MDYYGIGICPIPYNAGGSTTIVLRKHVYVLLGWELN
jgi:hypothetical protein